MFLKKNNLNVIEIKPVEIVSFRGSTSYKLPLIHRTENTNIFRFIQNFCYYKNINKIEILSYEEDLLSILAFLSTDGKKLIIKNFNEETGMYSFSIVNSKNSNQIKPETLSVVESTVLETLVNEKNLDKIWISRFKNLRSNNLDLNTNIKKRLGNFWADDINDLMDNS